MKTSNNNDNSYLLPEQLTKKQFLETLKSSFIVKPIETTAGPFSLLESFEWSLYAHRIMAVRTNNQSISLWDEAHLFDDESALEIDNINARSKFWWDFPDPEVQQILKPILKLRALHPVYQGILRIEQLNLQNEDGKLLVHCQLISIFDTEYPRTPLMRQVKISPITGYAKEYKLANRLLNQLNPLKPSLSPLDTILGAIGVMPVPFNIKPQLKLPAKMPARTAVSHIINTMISKQRMTEKGIIQDIDSEFLHHFRVAIRMVRAAIVQLKEVFPAQDVLILKERFGNMARETNKLRDLDVFIMDKARYMGLLPEPMRDDLLPMFTDFEKNRQIEAKRISRWIASRAYRDDIDELQAQFVHGYSAVETKWSERPTIELAVSKIQKSYKKIYLAARKINSSTADEKIHDIRIDCKKLRYLLYFFGSEFDKKKMKQVANHLKSLQDKLGIFNDLTVQGDFLRNYLINLEHKPKKEIMLIAALGGLISTLYNMQVQEREKCIDELAIFSNENNRLLFEETFAMKKKSAKQPKSRNKKFRS
ncbi:CHAD domain-containing protein [sulfur-oxidizing endosymbiont of Gigantopelta aegis]|uniref:CHAD domain-containing protein n=1 Tax=sulfur-oxidizing endosymbiont of Gigantopelta aegis TaxID=2794934 RepID=UPI0018DB649E|nr:CHAD domain-containing protein [sulfur-oxidizing endosymbiont of Gigantopelta aegis]